MNKTKDLDAVGYKIRLYPTKEQEHLFYEYFGMSRFVYNLCIDLQEEHYQNHKDDEDYSPLGKKDLRDKITFLETKDEYKWLKEYNVESLRAVIDDCLRAYELFRDITRKNEKPKYKSRKSKKQFYSRPDRITITNDYVKLSSIGKIKYCNSYGDEILGTGYKERLDKSIKYTHYYNARVSFDGLYFYLSFTIPKDQEHQLNSYYNYYNNEEWQEQESSEPIGIDVGLKNEKWMVDSTGTKVERPNSDALNKKINRLKRKYSRQKKSNLHKNSSFMEQHPNGSKNMQKTRTKINKCYKKITNRRRNAVHEYACSLLKKKPKAVVMESISVRDIEQKYVKNTGYHKNIMYQMTKDAALYESMQIIEQKMESNGIPVIKADPNYPSSQICSCCGSRHNIGRAKYYRCPVCGAVIDRDLNAAINLSRLAIAY